MKEFKCPDSLVKQYKPYACRLRQWITQHILVVLPICAMVSLPKGTLKRTLHPPTHTLHKCVRMLSISKHINIAKIKQLVGCMILFWNVCRKLRVSRRVEELYNKVQWNVCVCVFNCTWYMIYIKHFSRAILYYLSYFIVGLYITLFVTWKDLDSTKYFFFIHNIRIYCYIFCPT